MLAIVAHTELKSNFLNETLGYWENPIDSSSQLGPITDKQVGIDVGMNQALIKYITSHYTVE